nr:auxin efflux carrier [Coryphopteris nipponica]
MITGKDMYNVLSAMVPLYVAMMLGYGSVRWWGIFSAVQCSGINRFVAVFAVPLLSFSFISNNNPFKMDGKFILADSASKVVVFVLLACWARFSRYGSLDWMITLFSLATLPNTLVMGIPLLEAMYGHYYGKLMVQVVVLQSIIWYTLLLFLFELRAARMLLMEQFPETAASIVSFKVDPDVMSLDGREPLQTEAQVGEDGKIRVFIRRSISTSQHYELFASPRRSSAMNLYASPRRSSAMNLDLFASPRRSNMMNMDLYASPRRSNMNHNHTLDLFSMGLTSVPSSKAITPRPSNLTGAEIYSLATPSSQNTPRDITLGFTSTFNEPHATAQYHNAVSHHLYGGIRTHSHLAPTNVLGASPRQSNFTSCEMYSLQSSRCPTPRASNFQPNHHDHADNAIAASVDATKLAAVQRPTLIHSNTNTSDMHAIVKPAASVSSHKTDKESLQAFNISTSSTSTPHGGGAGGADHHLQHDNDHLQAGAAGKEPVQSFIWSSSASPPVSEAIAIQASDNLSASFHQVFEEPNANARHLKVTNKGKESYELPASATPPPINVGEDFSFGSRTHLVGSPKQSQYEPDSKIPHANGATSKFQPTTPSTNGNAKSSKAITYSNMNNVNKLPSSNVMIKLILQMVARKLIRNPNTYASLIGITWSLISYRYGIHMPDIIEGSLKILWQAGLGMAMFSLGLFMALQPSLIPCGKSLAIFAMAVRFLTGPAVMAASSIAVGLRGVHLHAAIVQAALPQGIVPFVFSREYDLHPDILSTAVIFGMLVALPTTLLYYVLLGI